MLYWLQRLVWNLMTGISSQGLRSAAGAPTCLPHCLLAPARKPMLLSMLPPGLVQMRANEEARRAAAYGPVTVRVSLPDGHVLQATFQVSRQLNV